MLSVYTKCIFASMRQWSAPRLSLPAQRSGGVEGNERLTVMTGAVLLILLAVECYTILRIGRLLTLHVFLGMLLLGPVARSPSPAPASGRLAGGFWCTGSRSSPGSSS